MRNISLAARRKSCNPKKQFEAKTVAILASSITHELKNYLAAINIQVELSESKLAAIKRTVKAADYLLNNLQLQVKGVVAGKPCKNNFELYSMTRNIEEALEQYPFQSDERKLITVEESEDFEYIGNPSLTNHVLYNLIKNALGAIKCAGKGKITIKLKTGKKFNKLIFRDTASGIPKNFLPKVFDLFESQKIFSGGTGVGLAFCKEIMKSYDGEITCRSKEREYTEFTLNFPLP